MAKHRKRRFAAFIIAGAVASFFGLAYAATATTHDAGTAETSAVTIAVIFSGLAQIGSAAFMIKKYTDKVDKDSETIPTLSATLAAQTKTVEAYGKAIQELYLSRNEHQDELTKIKVIHAILGCGTALGKTNNHSGGDGT